jgi:5-methylcytosine-specific restriction endonuclease McrA
MSGNHRRRRKQSLIRTHGAACAYCGTSDGLTLDHKIPKSCGGSDSLDNLQLLCAACNQAKADTGAGRTTVLRWRGMAVAA